VELELAKRVSAADEKNLALYRTWGGQDPASASFKLDGSLIIAFVWQRQLYTCTRRRMDSEQVGACGRSRPAAHKGLPYLEQTLLKTASGRLTKTNY
jgi:hypothetical protein